MSPPLSLIPCVTHIAFYRSFGGISGVERMIRVHDSRILSVLAFPEQIFLEIDRRSSKSG